MIALVHVSQANNGAAWDDDGQCPKWIGETIQVLMVAGAVLWCVMLLYCSYQIRQDILNGGPAFQAEAAEGR